MNTEDKKISNSHRLLFNLKDEVNLKGDNKYFTLSHLSMYYT